MALPQILQNYIDEFFSFVDSKYRVPVAILIGTIASICAQCIWQFIASKIFKNDNICEKTKPTSTDNNNDVSNNSEDNKDEEYKSVNWIEEIKENENYNKLTKSDRKLNVLIGVMIKENIAVLIEAKCLKSESLKDDIPYELIKTAANACIDFADSLPTAILKQFTKLCLDADQLKGLKVDDEKLLEEYLRDAQKRIDDKIYLKRATCYRVGANMFVSGYTLPAHYKNDMLFGKFGCVVAFKFIEEKTNISDNEIDDISLMLCQQIIAMNPSDEDTLEGKKDESLPAQNYIHDPNILMEDVLIKWNVEVVNFKRYENGDKDDTDDEIIETI